MELRIKIDFNSELTGKEHKIMLIELLKVISGQDLIDAIEEYERSYNSDNDLECFIRNLRDLKRD